MASDLENFTSFGGGARTPVFAETLFDMNNTAASGPAADIGAVSPTELFIADSYVSGVDSLPGLTSPSTYNDSPEFSKYSVSPEMNYTDTESLHPPSAFDWHNLARKAWQQFPYPASQEAESTAQKPKELEVVERGSQKRYKSSSSLTARHSASAGVKARRRDKPLPPIVVDDPTDTAAVKRARNTLAARKSRERKAMRLEELEAKIVKLEAERDHWKRLATARGN